ncbi:MAG: protein-L-isoaspartate(D-aspartate) O-methyltransferase [bacterium]
MPHETNSTTSTDERLMLFFWITAAIAFVGFLIACHRAQSAPIDFAKLREQMVTRQIAARGIRSATLLTAMRKVPRHLFVPEKERFQAYEDYPLPIGHSQTISQPYIVALMTDLLELNASKRVLEIGTGSGYQAAILAELAKEVYTIEILEPLAKNAEKTLKGMGYTKVHVRCGDGYRGWPEAAPFDAVIVTAAPDHIPQPLVDQLEVGGILVIPVGGQYMGQELKLIRKLPDGTTSEDVLPVRFVPMTGEAQGEKPSKK